MHDPFFDPQKSYEENFVEGPFGAFADVKERYPAVSEKEKFLDFNVNLPFGIPAGPLVNGRFVEAAFKMGFDLPTFKTVRTRQKGCHPWPNVVPVDVDGELTMEKAALGLTSKGEYEDPIAITNSFGVPSPDPDEWQSDMKKAAEAAGEGQVMIASYQGTSDGKGEEAFIEDHVLGAKMVKETGAKIVEVNLSCPNEGTTTLLCHDTGLVTKIADRIKNELGDTPLLLKMSYFPADEDLKYFLSELSQIVDGFVMINTIASEVRKPDGEQALPGEKRLRSGICGAPIMWAGLNMVGRVAGMRDEMGGSFAIVGCGGVTTPEDYKKYREVGADAVMSATGAMWNPFLAQEIRP